MDVDQASTFLAGSILTGAGFAIIGIVIVFLNNMFAKYWKPVKWIIFPQHMDTPARFASPEEVQAIDKSHDPKL